MNASTWLWTAACLAWGAPETGLGVTVAQATPVVQILQTTTPCYQGTPQGIRAAQDCCSSSPCDCCKEHGGFLARLIARLRGLFARGCSEGCGDPCTPCRTTVCNSCEDCGPCGLGLRHWLANLFHRPCATETPCCEPPRQFIVQAAPTVLPPVHPATPVAVVPPPAPIQPVSTVPTPPRMEIAKEYLERVANAADYSWVTGQLFYIHVHADQGLWVVRYAPVDKEDRYGGSVVLAPATSMTGYKEGDLVTVHGEILNQGRASRYLGGPLYRGLSIDLNDRGQH